MTNIYSTSFTIETADKYNEKKYIQTFNDNMKKIGDPEVQKYNGKPYTRITFTPDYKRFQLEGMTNDIYSLFERRTYDLCACSPKNVNVYFNNQLVKIKELSNYADLYLKADLKKIIEDQENDNDDPDDKDAKNKKIKIKKIYEQCNPRWEICAAYNYGKGAFEHVSFVNGINTAKGGTHVNYITDQICTKLATYLKKDKDLKDAKIQPQFIKNYLWIFIKSIIENPDFNSQTKEELTTKKSSFGSKCVISDKFIEQLASTGIVDAIKATTNVYNIKELKKMDGKKSLFLNIPKLDDANYAGRKKGSQCSLFVTEGDSAKSLAVAGLSIVGRNYYGAFPIRGKLINVRGAKVEDIKKNKEITDLVKILGLQYGKKYKDVSSLRYGSLVIMTDQDTDGSHIKGLLINFIHYFWPELIEIGFLRAFITPIIKATKKNSKKNIKSFFSLQDYEKWESSISDISKWNIKYYKGLATSSKQEAHEYFKNIDNQLLNFKNFRQKDFDKQIKEYIQNKKEEQEKLIHLATESLEQEKHEKNTSKTDDQYKKMYKDELIERSGEAIQLVFAKDLNKFYSNKRKKWLQNYDHESSLDFNIKDPTIYEFIHKEMIHFSNESVIRSVPSVYDSFKPSQRKIFYATMKKRVWDMSIKVAQLSGYISEHTNYPHGELSLNEAIIVMANDYIGSNNINLLIPDGQFGDRITFTKAAGAARYIFTKLNPIVKHIFNEEDIPLLKTRMEDGDPVEPEHYIPTFPFVLVNGISGIGTGYSTNVLPYNPEDIVENLIRKINGKPYYEMLPYYRGFIGKIKPDDEEFDDHMYSSDSDKSDSNTDSEGSSSASSGDEDTKKDKKTDKISKKKKKAKKLADITKTCRTYECYGKFEVYDCEKIIITEIPIKTSLESYKTFLNNLRSTKNSWLLNYQSCSTNNCPYFILTLDEKRVKKYKRRPLQGYKDLKLKSTLKETNVNIFDRNWRIKKYTGPYQIIDDFYEVRKEFYVKRRNYWIKKLKRDLDKITYKIKFLKEIMADTLVINKKKKEVVCIELEEKNIKNSALKKIPI